MCCGTECGCWCVYRSSVAHLARGSVSRLPLPPTTWTLSLPPPLKYTTLGRRGGRGWDWRREATYGVGGIGLQCITVHGHTLRHVAAQLHPRTDLRQHQRQPAPCVVRHRRVVLRCRHCSRTSEILPLAPRTRQLAPYAAPCASLTNAVGVEAQAAPRRLSRTDRMRTEPPHVAAARARSLVGRASWGRRRVPMKATTTLPVDGTRTPWVTSVSCVAPMPSPPCPGASPGGALDGSGH